MVLQVVPETDGINSSQINVMLNPRWVTLDRWDTFASDQAAGWAHKPLPFRQPVFGATSFQTQATVKDGGTVLLGSNSTPDGKGVHVGFLTARRVDVQAETSERLSTLPCDAAREDARPPERRTKFAERAFSRKAGRPGTA